MGLRKSRKFRKKQDSSEDEGDATVTTTEAPKKEPVEEGTDDQFYVRRALRENPRSAGVVYFGGRPAVGQQDERASAYSEQALEELKKETFSKDLKDAEVAKAREARQKARDEVQYMSLEQGVPDVVKSMGAPISDPAELDSEDEEDQRGWENEILRRAGRAGDATVDEGRMAALRIESFELEGTGAFMAETAAPRRMEEARDKVEKAMLNAKQEMERATEQLHRADECKLEAIKQREKEHNAIFSTQEKIEFFGTLTDYFRDLSEMFSELRPMADRKTSQALKLWRKRGYRAKVRQAEAIEMDTFDMGIEYDEQNFVSFSAGCQNSDTDASSVLSSSSDEQNNSVSMPRRRLACVPQRRSSASSRVAREARITRRANRRASKTQAEVDDGFSTSEDESKDDIAEFQDSLKELDASLMMNDVADDFASLEQALKRARMWLERFPNDYVEAFGDALVLEVSSEFGNLDVANHDWLSGNRRLGWATALREYSKWQADQRGGKKSFESDVCLVIDSVVGPIVSEAVLSCMNPLSSTRSIEIHRTLLFMNAHIADQGTNSHLDTLVDAILNNFRSTLKLLAIGDRLPADIGVTLIRRRFWMGAKCLRCYRITFDDIPRSPGRGHLLFVKELLRDVLLPCFSVYGGDWKERLQALTKVLIECLPKHWPDPTSQELMPVRAALLRLRVERPGGDPCDFFTAAARVGMSG